MPRPRPPPEDWAPGCWPPAPRKAVKRNATIELRIAARTRFRTSTLLDSNSMGPAPACSAVARYIVAASEGGLAPGRFGLARRGEQTLTGCGERHDARVTDERPILRLRSFDDHFVADVQRVAGPALPHQAVRAPHLHAPVHDLAVRARHVHVEVGVRVRPFDLGHDALEVQHLVGVELGRE